MMITCHITQHPSHTILADLLIVFYPIKKPHSMMWFFSQLSLNYANKTVALALGSRLNSSSLVNEISPDLHQFQHASMAYSQYPLHLIWLLAFLLKLLYRAITHHRYPR